MIWYDGLISLLFIAIAAACNAVMDRTENEPAYHKSVFKHLDYNFWCKEFSWRVAAKIFGWKYDAWHVSKSFMVIFLLMAVGLYSPILGGVFDFLLFGIVWNLTFNVFYNKILVD